MAPAGGLVELLGFVDSKQENRYPFRSSEGLLQLDGVAQ